MTMTKLFIDDNKQDSTTYKFVENLFEPIWNQTFPSEVLLYIYQKHTVGSSLLAPYNFAFVSESRKTGSSMFEIESGYENGDAYLKIFDLDYADDIENPAYQPTVEDFIKRVQPFIVAAQ